MSPLEKNSKNKYKRIHHLIKLFKIITEIREETQLKFSQKPLKWVSISFNLWKIQERALLYIGMKFIQGGVPKGKKS